MKKLLGIVVLGLLFSGNAYADKKNIYLMCSGYDPILPKTYNQYLNDTNDYFLITKKFINYDFNWKEGKFKKKIKIKQQNEELIYGSTDNFLDVKKKEQKRRFLLDKYSLKMFVTIGVIDKNLITKDRVKERTVDQECKIIKKTNLGRLKPRIN